MGSIDYLCSLSARGYRNKQPIPTAEWFLPPAAAPELLLNLNKRIVTMSRAKTKIKRQTFSSPAQLQKMAVMVIDRWHGVWTEVFSRHQTLQQGGNSPITVKAFQKSLSKTSKG